MPNDVPSWAYIHQLEIREAYPEVIDVLEGRLMHDPADAEAVIRLGFNLWFAVVENLRMGKRLPVHQYAQRFMDLFRRHAARMSENADFCWAFGLGMSLFWFEFPGGTEEEGIRLLRRARDLDPMWDRLYEHGTDLSRLKGRGIFEAYYNVA